MEDSNAMTIEFLRARLLSERSISRTARQRADELAKRVMELEKQLKVVSLQRKNAEKATVEVLAILENHGRSDVSETFDSSSDEEAMLFDPEVVARSGKGEEPSSNVKVGENGVESSSELESSSRNGRSLSWRSCKDSRRSLEKKYMDASRRRRSSFASSGSSSPKRVGKSCRQIKRRELRSAVEEPQNNVSSVNPHEDEEAISSEGVHNVSDIVPETSRADSENLEEKDLEVGPVSRISENHSVSNGHYSNNHGGEQDMERALEHQAQLIERYEAEEKAQREWEDKFRENNGSTPESCDPGNHSDVTEERDDIKAPPLPCSTKVATSQNQEEKLANGDAFCNEESKIPNDVQHSPHFEIGLQDEKSNDFISSKSPASEFEFTVAKGKHDEERTDSHQHRPLHVSHHGPELQGTSGNNLARVSSSEGSNVYKAKGPGNANEFALMRHENPDKLGSVLEALEQAKLSLQQNLNIFSSSEAGSVQRAIEPSGSVQRAIEPSYPIGSSGDRFTIPVGPAGFFKLPTDYQYEATTRANFVGSTSRLSIASYSPDRAGTEFFSSPYREPRTGNSIDSRFLTVPTLRYPEFRSGIPTQPPLFEPSSSMGLRPSNIRYGNLDRQLSAGLPSSSNYPHTTYPPYAELMPRMATDGRFPGRDAGVPPSARFPFHDDNTRPNLYR